MPSFREQLEYLKSRGYTEQALKDDGGFVVRSEKVELEGVQLKDQEGYVAWPVRAMSGRLIGVQTRSIEEKKYRWAQHPETHHLPIFFATAKDFQLIWEGGECVIAEGAFDRLAIKLAFPERAVIARLSKGAANQMANWLRRYCTTIWTAFDLDAPGIEATEKTEKKLGKDLTVNVLRFSASDPNKLLERKGVKGVQQELRPQFDSMGGW